MVFRRRRSVGGEMLLPKKQTSVCVQEATAPSTRRMLLVPAKHFLSSMRRLLLFQPVQTLITNLNASDLCVTLY